MANELATLSGQIAGIVERAAPSVVAVHARSRFSSSGVLWRPGVIVTAEHTVRREEEVTVTLPNGERAPATLAGSDAGTDIAVFKGDWPGMTVPRRAEAGVQPGNLALTIGRSAD